VTRIDDIGIVYYRGMAIGIRCQAKIARYTTDSDSIRHIDVPKSEGGVVNNGSVIVVQQI